MDKKQHTHDRILRAAGRMFKQRGLDGVGIDGVMKEAQLTHGGFYTHFRNKDALVAEMLGTALQQMRQNLFAGLDDERGVPWLTRIVRRYLSRSHRDLVADGCPMPALLGEIGRAGELPRRSFQTHLREIIAELEAKMPPGRHLDPHDRTLATLALCVGGLSLARAVDDRELSDRILTACRAMALPEMTEDRVSEEQRNG
jgi:TetR/AcrR family transcriptional regulator, transcriptional repressor for nem operon